MAMLKRRSRSSDSYSGNCVHAKVVVPTQLNEGLRALKKDELKNLVEVCVSENPGLTGQALLEAVRSKAEGGVFIYGKLIPRIHKYRKQFLKIENTDKKLIELKSRRESILKKMGAENDLEE